MPKYQVDVLIIGGGIAGLWLLASLKAKGVNALLCEANALGAGQTMASQGIIHGGTKYALTGQLSQAAVAIGAMPARWKAALNGQDDVNLQGVKCLAQHQLLWTSPNLASTMTGFFASKVMQSRMEKIDDACTNYPEFFKNDFFKGKIYQLDEPVLDVASLMQVFHQHYHGCLFKAKAIGFELTNNERYMTKLEVGDGQIINVDAKHVFALSGEGNEALIDSLGATESINALPKMQRRPLQMLYAKHTNLPMLYAHGLGIGDKPRITITSSKDKAGEVVWYIGGEPAEKSIAWSKTDAIAACKRLLNDLMPWLDTDALTWSSFHINRAEGLQKDGKRPDTPVYKQVRNVCFAWPTKLALAPMLSDQLLAQVTIKKSVLPPPVWHEIFPVTVSSYPWE